MYIHEICMKNVGQQKHKCNNKIICYIHTFVYKKKDIVVNINICKKKMKKKKYFDNTETYLIV